MLTRWLPTSTAGRAVLVVALAVALVLGVNAGRQLAYDQSVGGMQGAFAPVSTVVIIGVPLLGFAVAVWIAAVLRRGSAGAARRLLALVVATLAIGFVGGTATAAATGGTFVEPIVLRASGQARAEISGGSLSFAPSDGGAAECHSVPDGRLVNDLFAFDLGELGSGTLRAMMYTSGAGAMDRLELIIDGADLPEGSMQPVWTGAATVEEVSADRSSGRVRFDDFARLNEFKEPNATVPPSDWPDTLSGTISWTCDPWSAPEGEGPGVRESVGTTDAMIEHASAPFVPRDGGRAVCRSAEHGPLVASIDAEDLGELGPGTLRGSIFPNDGEPGTLRVMLFIDSGDLPDAGQPIWTGQALVVELEPDGAAGSIRLEKIPRWPGEKTPPSVATWDGPLSGTISWTCQPW